MRKPIAVLVFVTLAAGCAPTQPVVDMQELVLLSAGCANTETMRANLDEALRTMGLAKNYRVIDHKLSRARTAPTISCRVFMTAGSAYARSVFSSAVVTASIW